MDSNPNSDCIANELIWLSQRIRESVDPSLDVQNASPPSVNENTAYGKLIRQYDFNEADRMLLNLALAANLSPEILHPLAMYSNDKIGAKHAGGFFRTGDTQYYPTVRMAVFLLAGSNFSLRDKYSVQFHARHLLFTSGLVIAKERTDSSVFLGYEITFNDQFLGTILNGDEPRLDGEQGFPARRSTRKHNLADVVLADSTRTEIDKLRRFARNMKKLWSMNQSQLYRSNFIGIFSGEPGTGKSHTAEAVGNELDLPVYKVNFAQMVSKYIGETEKNLEKVFDRFDKQTCILFFDEAESIFSKRTQVEDAHDQHANNLQSYLLQKVEEFNGILILATNMANPERHFDKAFQRRIRLNVRFPFPDYPERIKLWERALAKPFYLAEGLLDNLAKHYQLTGGSIYNIVSDAVIMAMDAGTEEISFEMLEEVMKDEFKKTSRAYARCTDEQVGRDTRYRYGADANTPGFAIPR
jgi:AAA+ superfamily predicted ATPase